MAESLRLITVLAGLSCLALAPVLIGVGALHFTTMGMGAADMGVGSTFAAQLAVLMAWLVAWSYCCVRCLA